MNSLLWFGILLGAVMVIALGILAAYLIFPGLMLREARSRYDLTTTVDCLTHSVLEAGWVVQSVVELEKSVKKNGGGDILPVRLVNICQARHAATILNVDEVRKVSVLMPCTISVYEKTDGNVYLGFLNAGLLARFFGGVVARVMGREVAADQASFIKTLAAS